jgi:hypothetical protein
VLLPLRERLDSLKDSCGQTTCLLLTMGILPVLILYSLAGIQPNENNLSGMLITLIFKNTFTSVSYFVIFITVSYLILSSIFGAVVWMLSLFW